MNKCEDCKNKEICKWSEEMKRNQDAVSQIPICKGLTPIKIEVTCRKFEKNNTKQDGFYIQRK